MGAAAVLISGAIKSDSLNQVAQTEERHKMMPLQ